MTTLADLKTVGDAATILDITGDDAISMRLMEMGLTDGEKISVIRFAPLGDPVEYSVRGYRISLRKSEAQRVLISIGNS